MSHPTAHNTSSINKSSVDFKQIRCGHDISYYQCLPSELNKNSDILVVIHGISRNAKEQVLYYRTLAENLKMPLIAPLFDKESYPGYQRLSSKIPGKRSDLMLHRVINEVTRNTGNHSPNLHLVGYSGGAQFAHRFALLHPQRVRSLILCAAGWYTFPDKNRRFPKGLKGPDRWPPINPDLSGFLNIPMQVIVGSEDITRDETLNQNPDIDRRQGANRLERARNWQRKIKQAQKQQGVAEPVILTLLRDEGHDFASNIKNTPMIEMIGTFIQQQMP